MVDKITNNTIQNLLSNSKAAQMGDKNISVTKPDTQIKSELQEILNKAASLAENECDMIANARELLLSGKLDSEENIIQAAKNIIDMGI